MGSSVRRNRDRKGEEEKAEDKRDRTIDSTGNYLEAD